MEIFRLKDKDDYEYEIFSIPSSADGWTSAILAEKRDSRRHFTRVLARNSLWREQQQLEVYHIATGRGLKLLQ